MVPLIVDVGTFNNDGKNSSQKFQHEDGLKRTEKHVKQFNL